jgi:AraC-like DNA-binding protein
MYESFVFLRGLALGLILALVLAVVIGQRAHYAARVLAAFALSVCGYLLAPLLHEKTDLFYLAVAFADTTPLLFLLFTQAVFDEHRAPARISLWIGAFYLLAAFGATYLPHVAAMSEDLSRGLWLCSRVVMASMLAYALYILLRQWRQDLVQPRRLLRLTVTVVVCTYILGVVVVESILVGSAVPLWVEVANAAGIAISTLLFASVLLIQGPQLLSPVIRKETTGSALPLADQQEVDRIINAMEREHAYRDMALSIRSLGATLSIPEHRLRQRINQQLQYRNFNDFLNHYRIAETSDRLCDPASARTPILTIAMDAGYRSMTTFNKAFKARHEQTPMEYRQKHLSIS